MDRRTFAKGGGALACSALLAGWPIPVRAQDRKVLHAQISSLNSIDPAMQTSTSTEGWVSGLVSGSLLRYSTASEPLLEPALAKSFDAKDEGRTYTFQLRDDVTWHHGFGPFTAQDVKFSVDRVKDKATKARNAGQFAEVERVEVRSDHEVSFHLTERSPLFPHALANFRAGYLVSQRAFDKLGEQAARRIVGTGPYQIEEADLDNLIVLQRNASFSGEQPRLDGIRFKVFRENATAMLALDRGDLDMAMLRDVEMMKRYGSDSKFRIVMPERSTALFALSFNLSKPLLSDKRVRLAIAHGTDRKAIQEAVFGISGAHVDTIVPPGVEGSNAQVKVYAHDVPLAKSLVQQVGAAGKSLSLTLPTYLQRFGVVFQAMMAQIGLTIRLNVVDSPTWIRLQGAGDHDLYLGAMVRPPSGEAFLGPSFLSSNNPPQGVANSFYNGADDLILAARKTFSSQERRRIYEEAVARISADLPMLPITMLRPIHAAHTRLVSVDQFRLPESQPALERAMFAA